MKFKHRQFAFKLKSLDDKGAIAGYGSVFGTADDYRDVVMPGAFQKSLSDWKAKDAAPPMLWQHDSRQPIGVWTNLAEDGKGLYVEGQLLVNDVAQAAEAHALLKAKAISGMSIGYQVDDEEYDGKTNVNMLKAVKLWEISLVTFPANTDATVTHVKHLLQAGDLPSIKDFESLLRDAGGFSRKQATAIASCGYANFLKQRDADDGASNEDLFAEVLASIKSFKR